MTQNARLALRRLQSAGGVVAIGLFVMEHLWLNASELGARSQSDHGTGNVQGSLFLPLIEVFGIAVPLLFHAGYGMALRFESKPEASAEAEAPKWRSMIHRVTGVTGVLVCAFVLTHLWEHHVQTWLFGVQSGDFRSALELRLSSTKWGLPWGALGYLTGLAVATFHFASVIWALCASWGIAVSRAAQTRIAYLCGGVGTALFLAGALTVISLATGSRFGFSERVEMPAGHTTSACPPQ